MAKPLLACATAGLAAALSGSGCGETMSCTDWAAGNNYTIDFRQVSDACVHEQGRLPNGLQGGEERVLITQGFVEREQVVMQDGCTLRVSLEETDLLKRRVVSIKGDRLLGTESEFHGSVSIDWYTPELAPGVRATPTTLKMAKQAPVCSATAEVSITPNLLEPPLSAAAREALAGHGG